LLVSKEKSGDNALKKRSNYMNVILGSLIVIIPVMILGLVAAWRERRYNE